MPVTVKLPYEIDQYAEMEKEARSKEDESLSNHLRGLRKQIPTGRSRDREPKLRGTVHTPKCRHAGRIQASKL